MPPLFAITLFDTLADYCRYDTDVSMLSMLTPLLLLLFLLIIFIRH